MTDKIQSMKCVYIGIFIIPLLKPTTMSPVHSWLKEMDSNGDTTINGIKQPSLPPWVAMGNTLGKSK